MINLDKFSFQEVKHEILPRDHPLVRGEPINTPIYVQDYQWRLKIQMFSQGGFEAKAVLVNRNNLSRLINLRRERGGRRIKREDKDEATTKRDLEKCAYRAARRVRQLCLEIRADRLLTLTSRNLLNDYDELIATWKRFMRLLETAGEKFEYVAVPELHKNGEYYHVHAAINGFARVETLRRCWQIALGGKGNEKGANALGNVDIKSQRRKGQHKSKQAIGVAKYISKYISKGYIEHHQFNRKRYWAPRSIKLPETTAEWMQAEKVADVVQEMYSRFDSGIMAQAVKDRSIYITEANAPMVFFRYLPNDEAPLPTPF
ncbi:MAG: rolling circle replication-associated protein [Methylophilaceae bacterium]